MIEWCLIFSKSVTLLTDFHKGWQTDLDNVCGSVLDLLCSTKKYHLKIMFPKLGIKVRKHRNCFSLCWQKNIVLPVEISLVRTVPVTGALNRGTAIPFVISTGGSWCQQYVSNIKLEQNLHSKDFSLTQDKICRQIILLIYAFNKFHYNAADELSFEESA